MVGVDYDSMYMYSQLCVFAMLVTQTAEW